MLLLGHEVHLNVSNVILTGDKIHILQDPYRSTDAEQPPRINFAGCWVDNEPEAFIELDRLVDAPKLLVPPTTLCHTDGGSVLRLDYFRNSWTGRINSEQSLPIPRIVDDYEDGVDVGSFFSHIEDKYFRNVLQNNYESPCELSDEWAAGRYHPRSSQGSSERCSEQQ